MLLIEKQSLPVSKLGQALNTDKKKRDYFIHEFMRANNSNEKILYVHIPFCLSKCGYCVCQSEVTSSKVKLMNFVENVLKQQMREYEVILNNISFDQIYFGGGTPSILEAEILENIFLSIPNFQRIPKKCIECSPETFSYEHLDLFKKYKFNFISIGIQTLDKKLCNKHNRYYLTRPEIYQMSNVLRNSGIYFNYDLICFLGKGDVRDLPQFENDLYYIMGECSPNYITIHQLQQAMFTCEKTKYLQQIICKAIDRFPIYSCVNSNLNETDIYNDTVYQGEYRLARGDLHFTHYMWNKYAGMPVKGYDILSLGYTNEIHTISNVDKLFYSPGENKIKYIEYDKFIYTDYKNIRKEKGLDI